MLPNLKKNFISLLFGILVCSFEVNAQWPTNMDPASFQFNKTATGQGNAITQDGTLFRYNLTPWDVTNPTVTGQVNSMWNKNAFNFRNAFSLCFKLQVINTSTPGFQDRKTDGFTFNLQRTLASTPSATELAKIGQSGGGMGSLCDGANANQLIIEFDMYSNSNSINGCPGGGCDANDSQIAEHISINPDVSCTHAQNSGIAGNIMNPVAMLAGTPNYAPGGFPYTPTVRDAVQRTFQITWTPNIVRTRTGGGTGTFDRSFGQACPTSADGTIIPPAWTGCANVQWNDAGFAGLPCGPGVTAQGPCYTETIGGTFTISIAGVTRVTQAISNISTVMNPNNQAWDYSYIFGFASTSQLLYPDQIWITPCSNPVLPVDLVEFYATQKGSGVELDWKTATEKDNNFFVVERSINGIDFAAIGSLKGAGNSSQIFSYSYSDPKPYNGTSYYRLKQVDKDGSFAYSAIRSITLNDNTAIKIYPNPANGNFTVEIFSRTSSENIINIEVYNSLGQQVYTSLDQNTDSFKKKINIQNLPEGIYFVQVQCGEERWIEKLIKE
ncbi:MAG TPA: T9SS type A sorting domain-containing protein [Cytophagaceae bacterium]|nr:T9SS type A sorting domain-containing protein [Cytophagaceae bacterium]